MDLLQKEVQNGNLNAVKSLVDECGVLTDAKWTDYNLLRSALRYNKNEIIKFFLSRGFRVNRIPCTFFEYTPLHLAVNTGCLETIGILLNHGAFITSKNKNHETPLILAAKLNKFAIIDLMLSNISPENCANTENLSHMHIACMRNRIDIVKMFLQSGVEINHAVSMTSIRWAGYTALHFAVEFNCLETVDFLLGCGASLIARDGREQTPLHIAFMHQNNLIIDLILSAHSYESENPANLENLSHFHIACTRDNPKIVESFLLERKIDLIDDMVSLNAMNWSGYSGLHFAIEFECVEVVKLLLAYNAALGVMENCETCPINLAFRSGNIEIIKLLQTKYDKRQSIMASRKGFSLFHLACIRGEDLLLELQLLKATIETNRQIGSDFPQYPGWTALHLAVKHNRWSIAAHLLQRQADITIKDLKGRTPLHLAFELNNLHTIDQILSVHSIIAQGNPSNNHGFSHFHIACTRENIDVIKFFIHSGVDVNAPVNFDAVFYPGFTALHLAVKFKLPTVVQLLLSHNADITVRNGLGLTALDQAIVNYERYDPNDKVDYTIIELLLLAREQLNIDPAYNRGLSLLHIACARNDVAGIKRYLDDRNVNQIVDINSPKWAGYTPLHFAAYGNHDLAIALLLENRNCAISIKDADGSTPLHLRYVYNKFDFTSSINKNILVCEGNPVGSDGMSHFHFACVENDLSAVQYFLNQGVDVNLATNFEIENHWHAGTTALHIAVSHNSAKSLVQLLLEHGADVNARDAYMQTPLHRCGRNWETATIRMLVEKGADVNALDKYKRTPLSIASNLQYVDPKIATVLLEHGADINIESFGGKVPLSINSFAFEDNPNYIAVLMKHVKKLLIVGQYVSKKNKRIYSQEVTGMVEEGYVNEHIFTKQCLRELRAMRKINVDNYTTVKDIVFKSSNKMSRHAKNETLIKIANSKEFKKKFPIYGYLLKLQLKKGQERRPLLEAAQEALRLLSQRKLCSASIDKILDYLRGDDLSRLVRSTRVKIVY